MTKGSPLVDCPHCGQKAVFAPSNPWRPFCSDRCKMMDLGAWASNRYVIPGHSLELPIDPDDDETPRQ